MTLAQMRLCRKAAEKLENGRIRAMGMAVNAAMADPKVFEKWLKEMGDL